MNYRVQRCRALLVIVASLCFSNVDLFPKDEIAVAVFQQRTVGDSKSFTLKYVQLEDFKVNGKKEVRSASAIRVDGPSSFIAKDTYRGLDEVKIDVLNRLEWRKDLVFAIDSQGSEFVCVPHDVNYRNDNTKSIDSLYDVFIEGKPKGSKQKQSYRLKDVWRVYVVRNDALLEDVAFSATEGINTIAVWKDFLSTFSQSKRGSEGRTRLQTTFCSGAKSDIADYKGGSFPALGEADRKLEEARSLGQSPDVTTLQVEIENLKALFSSSFEEAKALRQSGEWDRALDALGPIQLYEKHSLNLSTLIEECRNGSNKFHRDLARAAVAAGSLGDAKKELVKALGVLPNSAETKKELDDVLIDLGLKETQTFYADKNYLAALERILSLSQSYPSDLRIAAVMPKVKSARAAQLLEEGRQTIRVPLPPSKPGPGRPAPGVRVERIRDIKTRADEEDFLKAHAIVEEAQRLAGSSQIMLTLNEINDKLRTFYVNQARQMRGRPGGGGIALAYAFALNANRYDPENPDVKKVVAEYEGDFNEKASTTIGLRTVNKAGSGGLPFLNEVEARLRVTTIPELGLPNVNIAESEQLTSLGESQLLSQLARGKKDDIKKRAILITLELLEHRTARDVSTQQRQSQYVVNTYINPRYQELSQQEKYWSDLYNRHRKDPTLGENHPTTQDAKARRNSFRDAMGQIPRLLEDVAPYSYTYIQVSQSTGVSLSYQLKDSQISQSTEAKVFQERRSGSDHEISGAQRTDKNAVRNKALALDSEETVLQMLQDVIRRDLEQRVVQYVKSVPESYIGLAESYRGRNMSTECVESYLLYALQTKERRSQAFNAARTQLKQHFNLDLNKILGVTAD